MQSVLPQQNSLKNNSIFLIDRVSSENVHPLYITLIYTHPFDCTIANLLQLFITVNKLRLNIIQVFR